MQKITSLQYQDSIWLLLFAKARFLGTISPIWGKAEKDGKVEDSFIFRNRDEAQFLKVVGFLVNLLEMHSWYNLWQNAYHWLYRYQGNNL